MCIIRVFVCLTVCNETMWKQQQQKQMEKWNPYIGCHIFFSQWCEKNIYRHYIGHDDDHTLLLWDS